MVVTPPSSKIRTYQSETETQRHFLSEQRQTIPSQEFPGSLDRTTFYPLGNKVSDYPLLSGEQDKAKAEEARKKQQIENKKFSRDLKQLQKEVEELERRLGKSDTVKPELKQISQEPRLPELPKQPDSIQDEQEPEKMTVYEQMLAEYEENKKIYDELYPEEEKFEQKPEPAERKLEYKQAPRVAKSPRSQPQRKEKKQPKTELEVLAESQRVLSELETFAVYSQDKFNQYMRAAEQYMQQGKYYLAADSYSMAIIYKPLDPLGYAGKCHALLASGDYVSSALNLSRAIEMFNGYVDFKIDIVAMIGDMDRIEKRIADIKAWLEINDAAELHFLLAYVYMQLDRLDNASESINAAYSKMKDVPSVGILKAAIEKRLGR
jgi:tetratricopeptide (TPR) repeat protein